MGKDAYYFSHDYNPSNDPKIICLLGNFGGFGYGVYWRIIELLHQEKDNKLPKKKYIFEAIAKQMLAKTPQIEKVINDCIKEFELFNSDDDFFWSERVLRNIEKRKKISDVRRSVGAIAKQNKSIAKQTLAKSPNKIKVNRNIYIESDDNFDQNRYIEEMINNQQPHISLIGKYFKAKGYNFTNKKSAQDEINRWLRVANKLTKTYKQEQIDNSYAYVSSKFPEEWNLNTVEKYINNPVIWNQPLKI